MSGLFNEEEYLQISPECEIRRSCVLRTHAFTPAALIVSGVERTVGGVCI